MHRLTARLLLLLTALPFVAPLTPLSVAQTMGMHCQRKPLVPADAQAPQMPCHHAMPMAPASDEQTSLQSLDCCCNHDCCRNLKTAEWAHPGRGLMFFGLHPLAPAPAIQNEVAAVSILSGRDSARAPPRT